MQKLGSAGCSRPSFLFLSPDLDYVVYTPCLHFTFGTGTHSGPEAPAGSGEWGRCRSWAVLAAAGHLFFTCLPIWAM